MHTLQKWDVWDTVNPVVRHRMGFGMGFWGVVGGLFSMGHWEDKWSEYYCLEIGVGCFGSFLKSGWNPDFGRFCKSDWNDSQSNQALDNVLKQHLWG